MSKEKCILCDQPLDNGQRINREHYIPQVLIRNFKKLRVDKAYTHALRVDLRNDDFDFTLAPMSAHKEWATVRVHEQCNLDASPMCRDFKYIIDHLDDCNKDYTGRIIEYYSKIWGMPNSNFMFRILTNEELDYAYSEGNFGLAYSPGFLWCGKILLYAMDFELRNQNDYEKHTIFMGPFLILKKVIKDYADGKEPDYANPY